MDVTKSPSLNGRLNQFDLTGVRVLFVDDELDSRLLVEQLLRDRNAEVVSAASAMEAMEVIMRSPPDVLVSDIGMPTKDGYWLMQQVCRLVPNHSTSLPAFALTAYARPEDQERAILTGFQMYASKPIEPVELVAKVTKLAGRPAAVT
jgi:CheY-like chemotaxis protein